MTKPIATELSALRFRQIEELRQIKPETSETSFADVFRRALGDASDLQDEAHKMITAFVQGEPVELHQVMAAAQEAAISLELLVEIRNKLTEAYRSVMNMQ